MGNTLVKAKGGEPSALQPPQERSRLRNLIHCDLPCRMSQSFSGSSGTPSPAAGDALAQTRTLWHYRPDYDYRPDLFQYSELYTTDPDYVVLDVSTMSPSGEHSEHLDQIGNGLRILIARFCRPPIHVSREVGITGDSSAHVCLWAPHPHPGSGLGGLEQPQTATPATFLPV